MCDVKVKYKVISNRLEIHNNLGTTAKQVVMVWTCVAKRQSLGEEMYGV